MSTPRKRSRRRRRSAKSDAREWLPLLAIVLGLLLTVALGRTALLARTWLASRTDPAAPSGDHVRADAGRRPVPFTQAARIGPRRADSARCSADSAAALIGEPTGRVGDASGKGECLRGSENGAVCQAWPGAAGHR